MSCFIYLQSDQIYFEESRLQINCNNFKQMHIIFCTLKMNTILLHISIYDINSLPIFYFNEDTAFHWLMYHYLFNHLLPSHGKAQVWRKEWWSSPLTVLSGMFNPELCSWTSFCDVLKSRGTMYRSSAKENKKLAHAPLDRKSPVSKDKKMYMKWHNSMAEKKPEG